MQDYPPSYRTICTQSRSRIVARVWCQKVVDALVGTDHAKLKTTNLLGEKDKIDKDINFFFSNPGSNS